MAKILKFTGESRLNMSVDQILSEAKGLLEGVLLIGVDHDGRFYSHSSYSDFKTILWLLEVCKQLLMKDATQVFDDEYQS